MNGKKYAEKLYPGQKNWIHIAQNAYNEGYKDGLLKQAQANENYRELDELRAYKKEMEAMLYNPERLADLIAGL